MQQWQLQQAESIQTVNEHKTVVLIHLMSLSLSSLELLSLMAAFLPLLPRTQEIARQFIVVVHSTLTSLPPSLLPGLSTQVCTLATNFAERPKSALSPLQLLCLHVANGISVLYTSGLFSADEAMGYVRLLADLATQAPLVCLYLSVSLAVFHILIYICFH